MLDSSFAAIVPMICVTLSALAAMVAESFRGKGEQMPIGTLGVIGLSERVELRPDSRRQLRALHQHHPVHRWPADDCAVRPGDSA